MIRVHVTEQAEQITAFKVSGHAGFANAGEDIVCAAVSILVYNAVNSCEKFAGVSLDVTDTGDTLSAVVPQSSVQDKAIQLLLQSMVFGIQQVADEFPNHIRIQY